MKKQYTHNEKVIVEGVNMIDYYNKMVVPLSSIYRPMSEGNTTGICPFHMDTDPSLHVWKKKGIYHCFGCNYGGDIIRTHQKLMQERQGRNLTKREVLEELAIMYNLTLSEEGYKDEFSNIYEEAIYRLTNKNSIKLPNEQESVVNFIKQNDRIRDNEHMTLEQKIVNYAELDLYYSVIASES